MKITSLLLLSGTASLLTGINAIAQKPNIILIYTDDMGYGDIGCFGGKFAPTPNLDKMAREGTMFTQYYSASPISSPSRTGLLTGMYPARWNITSYLQTRKGNRNCEMADFLNPAAPTVMKVLKDAGYVTGHFGKWHMGGGRDVTNAPGFEAYGADEHSSTWESPDPDPLITATNWIWSDKDSIKRWDRTRYFVDRTLAFLKNHKGQPCFVNLWPDDVHTPWVPGQERLGIYPNGPDEERKFRAVLDEYDRQMGRLFEGLKALGIDKNTLVIFTSDNGPLPGFKGSRAGGLRGSKLSLYEGGIRMPFIAWWPGHIPAGKVDNRSVICATDLLPTFCKISEGKLPKGFAFDGRDKSGVLLGKAENRDEPVFWEYGRNDTAFSYPKIVRDKSPNLAIRQGKWKFLVNADGSGAELYNLATDANENTNVVNENAETADRLKTLLLDWRKSLPRLSGN